MIVGIVAAKAHSNRFKDKNVHLVDGIPLFWHSVQPLLSASKVDRVCVATDSEFIKDYENLLDKEDGDRDFPRQHDHSGVFEETQGRN